MKKLEIQLKKYTVENGPRSERADLIERFLIRLNKERLGTKWKPLTARAVAIKLGHIPTKDLYFCLKQCEQAKSFGWCFFGMLKNRDSTETQPSKSLMQKGPK